MGSRSSKHTPKSYDVAPVVSDKDFSYKRTPRPLPEVKLPAVIITPETPDAEATIQATDSAETSSNVQAPVTTSAVLEIPEPAAENVQTPVTTSAVLETAETIKEEAIDPRIPTWVNEENFKPMLAKLYPNFVEIVSFKAYPALAAGENYATLMLRVKLTIKLQDGSTLDLSYMLKVAHDNKEMMEMLEHMNFFDVENGIYSEVIPEMEEMYRQAGSSVEFGAKSYQLAPEAPSEYYVLLEDLSLRSYKNANRLESLDMEHVQAVLRKLALFHAASACRFATKGAYPEKFTPDMDSPVSRGLMTQMFGSFKKPFMDNMKNFENGEKYEKAMDKFFDNLIEEFIYGRTPNPEYFNVLNHGDSWSNNILFKYNDDGKLEDCLFVDFQNTNYGSPAQDIFYFLISSAQVDIKVAKFEYFVHYYHQHLVENLRLLKYPEERIPPLRELHKQLLAYGSWATVTAFMTMGVVLLDPTDDAKFENFMGEERESMDFKNALYSNPRYIKHINEVLPWLYNHGFMETQGDSKIAATDKLSVVNPAIETVTPTFSYPEWVNESYFEDIVRADYENYQKILKFDVSPATSAGDNYSSIMLKVDIDIELTDNSQRSLSYMLKIPPAGEQALAIMAFLSSFVKEIKAYNEIVPQLEKVFQEQANVDVVFGPKSYKPTKDSGCDTLILENLRLKGFKNCDRLQGFDVDHTKAVLKKMAQLHAASAYMFETKGNFPEVFERATYREEIRAIQEPKMVEFHNIYLDCVKQYNGNEEYIDSMDKFFHHYYDCMMKAFKLDFSKFNVLNHGDCWLNNIMFQYNDKGDIANTYFVDYQLMRYGSPAYDLYYFLLTSTKLEIKLDSFEYFIRYYHENLKENLELLKYPKDIPTLKELHLDLLEYGPYAVYATMAIMGAVLMEPSENASLETMMKPGKTGEDFKKRMFLNQCYRSHAEVILPWLQRRGLFELDIELPEPTIQEDNMKKINVPSWIDAEHFEDILKSDFENFDKITSINASSATKSGDNYASSLMRVKVEASLTDGSNVTKSYILKVPLESESEKGMVSLWNFFEKEITMYSKYLPEFEQIYAQNGGKFSFGPKFYKFSKDVGKDIILMEDLGERGFKCGNRREGLDMTHAKCVLTKLAQFHAASVKYEELNGPFPEIFHKGVHTEETRDVFGHVNFKIFLEYFNQFENNEGYIDKVPGLLENSIDENIRVGKVDPTEFNVLNHGDSWLNNIMFKHDDAGNIEHTYFVDFQVCKYGTPAQDLWYFIMSSTELDIKVDSFDYFIRYYHEQLVENLKLLKYSGTVLTLSELHQMMLKYGYIGYSTTFGTTAICLLESSENANLTNFTAETTDGKIFRDALFLNDKYKANAAVVFPWLAQRGCMD